MCDSLIEKYIDHFHLKEVLGQGGMGCVYKALDVRMDRYVALKIIHHNYGAFSIREGKALGQLNHPNIVNVFYMDDSDEGIYIVMEYVDGKTLKHYKNAPIPQALGLLKQSLLALEHAHNAGVVHRDIKPGNIMVNEEGQIKVMDFGLAKVNSGDRNRTLTRFRAGTLNYMSPEQVRGLLHEVDYRSDIYSLGKAFYEILAGQLPFNPEDSDEYEICKMIVEVRFNPPSHFNKSIPADVDELIMKALEKDPDDRYQDARSMIETIDQIVARQSARPSTPRTREPQKVVSKHVKPKKWLLTGIAAAAVILIGSSLILSNVFTVKTDQPSIETTRILVTSNPPGARITINDEELGVTPTSEVDIAEEHLTLKLEKEYFAPLDTTITVAEGVLNNMYFELTPVDQGPANQISSDGDNNNTGIETTFNVESNPSGAIIRLDGVVRGTTPLSGSISPGVHTIRIERDGYEVFTQNIEFEEGQSKTVSAELQEKGVVVVSSNQADAAVSVNGRRVGITPITIPLSSGDHVIVVSAPGFESDSRTIRVRPEQQQTFNAQLSPQSSLLRIRSYPPGAIYLNGVLEEQEAIRWFEKTMPVGRHTVRVTHPTLGEWRKEILLEDDTEELRIDFSKELQVRVTSGLVNGAQIYVDDELTEFETPTVMAIRVGLRKITVKKEGFSVDPPFQEILIWEEKSEPTILRFTLTP